MNESEYLYYAKDTYEQLILYISYISGEDLIKTGKIHL